MGCNCSKFNNTGVPAKDLVAKDIAIDIYVAPVADDGTENYIDLTDVAVVGAGKLLSSYIDAQINNADGSKRWYPVTYSEVTPAPREYQTQGLTNGVNLKVGKTPEGFVGVAYARSAKYIKAVQGFSCNRAAKYGVDSCGNLLGIEDKANKRLYPILIQDGTFDSRVLPAIAGSQAAGVEVDYQISILNDDASYALIADVSIESNLLALNGLLDVCVEVTNVEGTNDGFTIVQTTRFGDTLAPVIVAGWETADYTLTDSTGATVTITGVTESPEGTYTFAFTAVGAGDRKSVV